MVRGLLRGDDATNSARATMRRLVRRSQERRGAMAPSSGGSATCGHARTSTCTPEVSCEQLFRNAITCTKSVHKLDVR